MQKICKMHEIYLWNTVLIFQRVKTYISCQEKPKWKQVYFLMYWILNYRATKTKPWHWPNSNIDCKNDKDNSFSKILSMPSKPLHMISLITLFIHKDVSIEELCKQYNVIWPLEVDVGSRIWYMFLAEKIIQKNHNIKSKRFFLTYYWTEYLNCKHWRPNRITDVPL